MITSVIIDDERQAREVLQKLLLRYFKDKIEVKGLAASVEEGVKIIHQENPNLVFLDIEIFSKEGEHYLAYTQDPEQTIELNLAGEKDYTLEIIDTWNMKIVAEQVVGSGEFQYKTKMPYTALRLIAK